MCLPRNVKLTPLFFDLLISEACVAPCFLVTSYHDPESIGGATTYDEKS